MSKDPLSPSNCKNSNRQLRYSKFRAHAGSGPAGRRRSQGEGEGEGPREGASRGSVARWHGCFGPGIPRTLTIGSSFKIICPPTHPYPLNIENSSNTRVIWYLPAYYLQMSIHQAVIEYFEIICVIFKYSIW